MRVPTALILLPALLLFSGCGRVPSLPGKVTDIVGVEGEYFPKSDVQRTSFKGGAAEGQAIARLILQGRWHSPCKCPGRAVFDLLFADGSRQSVVVFRPEATIGMGQRQYEIDMGALLALLEKLSSPK
jgi:hypothetical protein